MFGSGVGHLVDLERGGKPLAQARGRDLAILRRLVPPEEQIAELLTIGAAASKLFEIEHADSP